jgi:hypothetical protein
MTPRLRAWIAPLLFSLFLLACGDDAQKPEDASTDARPEGYCDGTVPCADEALPFCDLSGSYPDSGGQPNTCIAKPLDVECADKTDCSSDALPQCTTAGECVECLNFSHCNNENPLCSLSTHTCGSCRFGEEGDAICLAIDPYQPFCAKGGSCVECLDNTPCSIVSSPICDLTTGSCRGCVSSEECSPGTCNTVTGVCEAP